MGLLRDKLRAAAVRAQRRSRSEMRNVTFSETEREIPAWNVSQRISASRDYRRKTNYELQSALGTVYQDSSLMPGGQARSRSEMEWRAPKRDHNGRKAYPEFPGHAQYSSGWDSSMTKKHDLGVVLPPGVSEKIQRRAWKQVEHMMRPSHRRGLSIQPEMIPLAQSKASDFSWVDSSYTKKFSSPYTLCADGSRSSVTLPPVQHAAPKRVRRARHETPPSQRPLACDVFRRSCPGHPMIE